MKRKRGRPKKTSVGLEKQKQKTKPKSKLVQEVAAKDTVSSDGASLNSQEKLALDDLVRACGMELESEKGITRSRSQQISQKQREVNATIGDSVRSLHEPTVAVSANLSKQAGGGKTRSSRGLASCNMESNFNGDMLLDGGTHLKQQRRTRSIVSKSPRGYYCSSEDRGYDADLAPNGLTRQEESHVPYKDSGYKEQELIASLKVIRRVMEMDAAGPFNVPVDADALEIPDYFNIIDTPMDFGTICKNLERGVKYGNSKDVLKDVQLIWDNCTKYNKKGHYILVLMKRVKENFTRLWMEAQLPSEPEEETYGHSPLHPANFSTSSLHECRNPSSSISQFARHRHDRAGIDELQPRHSSLSYSQSHQYFQGPWHHQGSSLPKYSAQPHSYQNVGGTVDLDDYSTHQQHMQTHWSHQLQQQHPSLSGSHTQPSSCCPPISQQVPHAHQTAGRFNPYEEPLHFPQESAMRATPYGHQFPSGYMEDNRSHPRKVAQNQMGPTEPQLHQPTVNQFGPSSVQLQPSQPVACAAGPNAGDTYSSPPEESMMRYVPCAKKRPLDPKSNMNHQQQDGILPSHKKLHQTPPCDQPHNPEQGTHADNVNSSPLNPRCGQLPLSPEPTSPETDIAENTYSPPAEESMRRRTRSSTRPSVGTDVFAGCQESNYSTPTQQENRQDPLDPAVANGDSSSSKKGRRPPQFYELLWNMKGKITIATNNLGQPIGPDTNKLSYFIGTIGRNGHLAPLNYAQWRAVPDENKEKMWQLVQAKFDIDPKSYAWVMKSIGNRWRNWKCLLKTARYNTHNTDEERLADIDERVIPEQWRILVKYWNSEESQKRSSISKANRSQYKFQHATGSKSYARLREEERAKRPDGKEPTKADFFIRTRTRKDGRIVNDETSKVISQLREKAAEHQGTTEVSTIEDDVFFEVMGEENLPRLRALGLRPAPSDVIRVLRSGEEAIKMAAEANTEVREMKERMMSMEQTCAQMASQMAAMMAMMSTVHGKVPDKNLSTATVSPPEPQQALPAAEVLGGSVRSQEVQALVGRKRKKNKAIAKE